MDDRIKQKVTHLTWDRFGEHKESPRPPKEILQQEIEAQERLSNWRHDSEKELRQNRRISQGTLVWPLCNHNTQ